MAKKQKMIKSCLYGLLIFMLFFFVAGCIKSHTQSVQDQQSKQTMEGNAGSGSQDPRKQADSQSTLDKTSENVKEEKKDHNPENNVKNTTEAKKQQPNPATSEQAKEASTYTVSLWVTQNYGQNRVLIKKININKGDSVLDILNRHARVETAYGGSFVNGINGIVSGYTENKLWGKKKMDWFYYVNGVTGNQGSDEYQPQQGDVIWWDYHQWGSNLFIPTIVGAYPEPFVHGYRGKTGGVTVLTVPEREEWGNQVKSTLTRHGAKNVSLHAISDHSVSHRSQPTIVVGSWEELEPYLKSFNTRAPKNGIFARFNEHELCLLNEKGETATVLKDGAGLVAATGSGMGDVVPLWLVIGTDAEGVKQAIGLLERGEKLRYHYGVAVADQKVYLLPGQ